MTIINRPALPNWGNRITQEIAFKTTVFRAEDGTEVRVGTAVEPRVSWAYEAASFNGRNLAERVLPGRIQGALQRIPDPVEKFIVEVSATATFIQPVYWDETAGQFLQTYSFAVGDVLYLDGHGFCTVTATSVVVAEPSGAVMDVTVDNTPPEGVYTIHLTNVARQENRGAATLPSSLVTQRQLDYRVQPPLGGSYLLNPAVTFPEYRGYPLHDFRINWATTPRHEVSYDSRDFDQGYGVPFNRQVGQLINQSTFNVVGASQAEVREVIAAFINARGRHGSFYAPVALPSISLRTPAVEGNLAVVADIHPDYLDVWNEQILRNIMLVSEDGKQPNGITNVEARAGGAIITLDAPITAEAAGATSFRWLAKSRFSNDTLAVKWETNEIANFAFAITAIIDSFHEIRINEFRIMFGDYYVAWPSGPLPNPASNPWEDT